MALNNITKEQLEVFAEEINEKCPVLEDARSTQKDLKGRTGGKIEVVIPDVGATFVADGRIPTLGEGGDITNLNNDEFKKVLEVSVATNAVAADSLELVTDVDSFEKEIASPRATSVGRSIEKNVIAKSWTCADSARVYTTIGFGILDEMSGDLGDSEVTGELVGYMSHGINAEIAKSGLGQFLPPILSDGLYKESKIGMRAGIDWKKTAMPVVNTTAATAPSAITAVSAANGTITCTCASGAKYVKGYAFTIAGVYKKDLLGNDTNILKAFIVTEDCTATGTSVVLKVGDFSATGAHANVSRLPATTDSITAITAANKKYGIVWGFAKGNLEFSPVKLSSAGLEEVSAKTINGKLQMSAVVHANENRQAFYRFDSAFVAGAVDSRRAAIAYVEL